MINLTKVRNIFYAFLLSIYSLQNDLIAFASGGGGKPQPKTWEEVTPDKASVEEFSFLPILGMVALIIILIVLFQRSKTIKAGKGKKGERTTKTKKTGKSRKSQ